MFSRFTGTRLSLVSVFSASLSVVFLLFLILSWLTFSRLLNFESILVNISEQALPKIVSSSQLYGEAARLLEFADLFSDSTSEVGERRAEQKLTAQVNVIKAFSNSYFNNEFFETQLEIINIELIEFSELIKERLTTQKKLMLREQQSSQLFAQAFSLSNGTNENIAKQQAEQVNWLSQLSQAMVMMNRALISGRLQEVRGLFSALEEKLDAIQITNIKSHNAEQKQQVIRDLNRLLFEANGLEALSVGLLRLNGREIGRKNFLHHLIDDYTRLLEHSAKEIEADIFAQTSATVAAVKQQRLIIGSVIVLTLIVLFIIIMIMQRRVLTRLRQISNMVHSKTLGKNEAVLLSGNDEISDLADAFTIFANTIEIQKQKLEHMSMSDGLTGIANRRALDMRLLHDIELSIRHKSDVAVLLMDIDNFKAYNDNYGHSAGDECLKHVCQVVCQVLRRDSDFVARYGGEEFVCIMPHTDINGAKDIAHKIIQTLTDVNLPHQFSPTKPYVTMSIGIAVSNAKQVLMPDTILNHADTALYAAKKAGKNRFEEYSAPAL
jgi:diguanylate cyclase (GGDEF)-like protein